jgi:CO/xanthine dehydrogenase Mo-binding subunit
MVNYKVIGHPAQRADAINKATGYADFVADLSFPNQLWAAIYRSPYAHARILALDTEAAAAAPGVAAIITGKALKRRIGDCVADFYPIAKDKVRYVGEPVAAVLGESLEQARYACSLIKAEYEILPHSLTAREAMKPDAPLIHEEMPSYTFAPSFKPEFGSNVFHHYILKKGEPEKIFCRNDIVIVESEFDFPHMSHAALEPHGALACFDPARENLKVWTCAQSPFFVRKELAKLFDLPLSKVKISVPFVGGGFGGKSDFSIEPLTAWLAWHVPGRPVKFILSREEVFYGAVLGRGANLRCKMAFSREGKILAAFYDIAYSCGAYGDTGVNIVTGAGHNATGPYRIDNIESHSRAVYTNTPFVGAFRGYGHPEGHFMTERMMDLAARKLKIDPLELRRRNLLAPGEVNALGQTITEGNGNLAACFEQAIKEIYSQPTPEMPGMLMGRAVSPLMKSPVLAPNAASSAIVKINPDGTAQVLISGTEMGQGCNTALAQIAAESLNLPLDKVCLMPIRDTDATPYEWQTVASSTTWKVGNAIAAACQDALQQMRTLAAEVWQCRVEEVELKEGFFSRKDNPELNLSYQKLALGYQYPNGSAIGGPVVGYGYFMPEKLTYPDPETGQGNMAAEWTFGAQGVELAVNIKTGKVKILKLVTVIDAGKVINPVLARGQVVGAMVQGLGGALWEGIKYDAQGTIRNPNFTDYKIPTPEDLSETKFIVHFLENPQAGSVYGARPLGEHAIVAIAPIVANAVREAVGVDFNNLPLTADAILVALEARKAEEKERALV